MLTSAIPTFNIEEAPFLILYWRHFCINHTDEDDALGQAAGGLRPIEKAQPGLSPNTPYEELPTERNPLPNLPPKSRNCKQRSFETANNAVSNTILEEGEELTL
jgi:hypothetical protein